MIDVICGHIHNYFTAPEDIRAGEYTIQGGSIDLPFLVHGQYYRIVGSALNDGVYQYGAEGDALRDETFDGEIWAMKPPRAFIALCGEIGEWQSKYGAALMSPYQSESVIGVYTYQRAANAAGADADGWRAVFAGRLNQWRKLA